MGYFVSIIIPVSRWNNNLKECLNHCVQLDYPDFEVIVLPDEKFTYHESSLVQILPTGNLGPAEKRNIGMREARGDIIAFIDDDTYPVRDWLKNVIRNFSDPETAAVGGPAVTPQTDSLMQQASGAVYSSLLGGGGYRYRYVPMKQMFVDDFPSCNLIVRKNVLEELGGFKTNFWPGEDTALCLDIVKKLKKKIIYDPEAIIYHHRRTLFKSHLKQVKAYALHRGYFAKRYPETSFRLSYFIPSFFILFLLLGWIVDVKLYLLMIFLYLIMNIVSVIPFKTLQLKVFTLLGTVATHIVYGIWFIKGLLSRRLKDE